MMDILKRFFKLLPKKESKNGGAQFCYLSVKIDPETNQPYTFSQITEEIADGSLLEMHTGRSWQFKAEPSGGTYEITHANGNKTTETRKFSRYQLLSFTTIPEDEWDSTLA